jgi:aromatic-L-amino-acid/L-tryptophan decarboxylase
MDDLDLDADTADSTVSLIADAVRVLRQRASGPVVVPTDPDLLDVASWLPGREPGDAQQVLERLVRAASGGVQKCHGGDLAYIPSGGIFTGAVAAWLAASVHAFTGVSFESPALVALEQSVLGWMAGVVGFPSQSEGLLLSGGSLANQTALICARHDRVADDRSVAYLSHRVHHSIPKALDLAGLGRSPRRTVPRASSGLIDRDQFSQLIAQDRADGLQPWLVVGVAGDTDAGRVDPLNDLADVAAEHALWFHVDAAYGGFFALTERGRERLAGIERADSLILDAHKSLFLPYGLGAVLVRRPGLLGAAHGATASYLRDIDSTGGLVNYLEMGPENTRPFRGLLAWLPLQLHGTAAFCATLDRMFDLAADAARRLADIDGITVLESPTLSITAFRARDDDMTETVLDALNRSGEVHVSSTTIDGLVHIRLAFLHPRTTQDHVDHVVSIVREACTAR